MLRFTREHWQLPPPVWQALWIPLVGLLSVSFTFTAVGIALGPQGWGTVLQSMGVLLTSVAVALLFGAMFCWRELAQHRITFIFSGKADRNEVHHIACRGISMDARGPVQFASCSRCGFIDITVTRDEKV